MNDTALLLGNPLRFRKNLLLNVCWCKNQSNRNKIEQNQAQYDLDRQTAKISVLSSGNVGNYHFLTGKGVLPK